jgi:Fur family ferric uptake transcriptional regulator
LINETLHCREKVAYEKVYKKQHHDHLICINCGKIIEFYNEKVEELQNEICKINHFYPIEHRLGIKGYCKECIKKIRKNQNKIKKSQ